MVLLYAETKVNTRKCKARWLVISGFLCESARHHVQPVCQDCTPMKRAVCTQQILRKLKRLNATGQGPVAQLRQAQETRWNPCYVISKSWEKLFCWEFAAKLTWKDWYLCVAPCRALGQTTQCTLWVSCHNMITLFSVLFGWVVELAVPG